MKKTFRSKIAVIIISIFCFTNTVNITQIYADGLKQDKNEKQKENLLKQNKEKLVKKEKERLHKLEENNANYNGEEEEDKGSKVRVTVETYDGLINNSNTVERKVKKDTNGEVQHKFGKLIKGFSIEVKKSDLEKIKRIPGVKEVKRVRMYKPTMNTARELGEAVKVWKNLNYKGEGMVVSVVDTGIDYTHKDMKLTDANTGRIKKEHINGKHKGKYFTDKVPYGYNFADQNTDVIDKSGSMHGIHVAGISSANGDESKIANNEAIKGVAPESQLLAMKVFSNNPHKEAAGAFSDDIVAAIEESVELGADIINLSLGADSGFIDENDPEQKAIKKATEKGVIVVAAAGNAGFSSKIDENKKAQGAVDTGLLDNPGLGKESIQVASYENENSVMKVFQYKKDGKDLSIPYIVSEIDPVTVLNPNKELEVVDCGYGRRRGDDLRDKEADDFKEKDLNGKVALIKRGKINFDVKKKNAQRRGAIAAIIYNSDGDESFVSMEPSEYISIPCVFTGNTYGKQILKDLSSELKIKFTGNILQLENLEKGKMSNFSCWGPTPNLEFKPEITAPGGKIFSTINDNKYANYSGTSMATPYVAGGVALIKQAIEKSNVKINESEISSFVKNNMINTAKVLNNGKVPYSPRVQGGGLIQIEKAINNKVIIMDNTGKSAVSLKEIGNKKEFELTLNNYGDKEAVYQLQEGIVYTEDENIPSALRVEGAKLKYSKKEVKIKPYGREKVKVSLEIPKSLKRNNFVEGFIEFKSKTDSNPSLSVPYMGFYGDWGEPENIDKPLWEDHRFNGSAVTSNLFFLDKELGEDESRSTEDKRFIVPEDIAFSPDEDGFYDYAVPALCVLRNLSELKVDILDKDKNFLMTCGNKKFIPKTLELGKNGRSKFRDLAWDGKIYDKNTGKNVTAEDGQYYMRITSKAVSQNAKSQSFDMPVKVDKTKPDITILSGDRTDNGEYTLKWKAEDKGVGIRRPEEGTLTGEPQIFIDNMEFDITEENLKQDANGVFSVNLDLGEEPGSRIITLIVNDNILNAQVVQKVVGVSEKPKKLEAVLLDIHEGMEVTNEYMVDNKYVVTGKLTSNVNKVIVNGVEGEVIKAEKRFEAKIDLKEGKNNIDIKAYDNDNKEIFSSNFNIIAHITPPELEISTEETILPYYHKKVFGMINTNKDKIKIKGKVNLKDNIESVEINYDSIDLDKEGRFEKEIELKQGINEITVVAKNNMGVINKKILKVVADYKKENFKFKVENLDIIRNEYENLEPNTFFGKGKDESKSDGKDDSQGWLQLRVSTNKDTKSVKINDEEMKKENIMEYTKKVYLKQGLNKIRLYIEDTKGSVIANFATNIYYDSESPVIRLKSPNIVKGKIYTNKNTITLKGDVADNTLGYRFYINRDQVLNVEQYGNFDLKNTRREFKKDIRVKNGDKIELHAKDICMNETSQYYEVVVDKAKPQIKVTGLEEGKVYKEGSKIVPSITTNKESAYIEAYLDGSTNPYKGEIITSVGKHELLIKARDLAGNESVEVVRFSIKKEKNKDNNGDNTNNTKDKDSKDKKENNNKVNNKNSKDNKSGKEGKYNNKSNKDKVNKNSSAHNKSEKLFNAKNNNITLSGHNYASNNGTTSSNLKFTSLNKNLEDEKENKDTKDKKENSIKEDESKKNNNNNTNAQLKNKENKKYMVMLMGFGVSVLGLVGVYLYRKKH
ncbi:S8 family serine peptidase [Hathewaya histolytica]|uniref:Cell wall-associated serine proteinase n=1 Tax=Hathewaya histolytica TaxID=1498 RepID=A0A4U9QZQ4_HATHI|nr:S8 family serine peptidase [Hathewaya histolytica]VTQ84139.1 cell wall-associated serine proteinase [Hathewaya histolytica]